MDGVATTYDLNEATVLASLRRVHHPSGDLRLRDINFQVRRGELFGIVGPQGSGKRSLLRLLAGLEQPADGEVDIFNVRSNGRPGKPPHQSQVGFVSRDESFDSRDIVGELVDASAREFGLADDELRDVRVRDSLAQTRLLEAAEWPVGRLSIGMQRRLSIARVLVRRPDLIILDEPLHEVEHVLRDPIWTIIDRLRNVRATVVIATEDLSLADRFDRVLVLSGGDSVALGGPGSIRRDLFGGDVLCLRVDGLDRALTSKLLNLPYVLRGIRLDDQTLEVIVADRNRDLNRLRRVLGRVHDREFVIQPYSVSFERVFHALAS